MRTIGATARSAFLSGDVTPEVSVTVRQRRLDFGGAPYVQSASIGGSSVSDDYFGRYVWGDSCVTASYLVRIVNQAAWGGTADFLMSYTSDGTSWAYADITNVATVAPYCRIGCYPTGDSIYVWYATSSGLVRSTLDVAAGTWSQTSTALALDPWTGLAVHPVSASRAFVVGYTSHAIWVRDCSWNGAIWSAGAASVVWYSGSLCLNDAQFSDAVSLSGTEYIIGLNLADHGAAYAVHYDTASAVYSQPTLMAGGEADWTGYRVLLSGMSVYNGRIWAVCHKALESSSGDPQADHVGLLSSADGRHWREDDFVGVHNCRGKLLYKDTYCYVAGNASVYRATASAKLGNDDASLKRVLDEDEGISLTCNQANAPSELRVQLKDIDDNLDTDPLFAAGNDLVLEITSSGEAQNTLATTTIIKPEVGEDYRSKGGSVMARGPVSRLSGKEAYQPSAGRAYDSPMAYYTDFNFDDSGLGRVSVTQRTGTWASTFNYTRGRYELKGTNGLCILPRQFERQWLTLHTHFTPCVTVDGDFVLFYWEDDDNYWRAGLTRDSGSTQVRLVIQQVVEGTATQKATADFTVGTQVYFYLDIRPGRVRAYANTSSDDFSSATTSVSYNLYESVPESYHVGFEVVDFIDNAAANKSGTVTTDSGTRNLVDLAQSFAAGDVGQQVRVRDQWRQVARVVSGTQIQVDLDWADAPQAGDSYGLYDTEGSPYMLVQDLAVCDGNPAWTVDDITNNILEQAGVTRTSVYSRTITTMASSSVLGDVDVRTTSVMPGLYIHCSAQASFSGLRVATTANWTTLQRHTDGVGTTIAVFPNLVSLAALSSTELRYIYKDGTIYAYAGDYFLCCFWNYVTAESGYVGVLTGSGTTTEFPSLEESFIWSEAEAPTAALSRLLRGRPAKMVERADGSLSVSRYETHDDLGTWSTTVRETGLSTEMSPALIEIEGADVRQYWLDKEQARRGLMYRKLRNESAWGDLQTLTEGVKAVRLAREEANQGTAELHAPDLAAELEDEVTVEGVDYIVQAYNIGIGHNKWSAKYKMRKKVAAPTAGVWGTDHWGDMNYG